MIVIVADLVIVIPPMIVAVHVNVNPPVIVLAPVTASADAHRLRHHAARRRTHPQKIRLARLAPSALMPSRIRKTK